MILLVDASYIILKLGKKFFVKGFTFFCCLHLMEFSSIDSVQIVALWKDGK